MIPGNLALIDPRSPLFVDCIEGEKMKGATLWTKDKLTLAFVVAIGRDHSYGRTWVQVIANGEIKWTLSKWLNYDTR